MGHRKQTHRMVDCKKFLKNRCSFSNDKFWYTHKEEEQKDEEQKDEEPKEEEAKDEAPLSQATWIKMTFMMMDLKNMMEEIRIFQN